MNVASSRATFVAAVGREGNAHELSVENRYFESIDLSV